jgi:hypothetical protein
MDKTSSYHPVEVMEALFNGIHEARTSHPILAIVATRSHSAMLAYAALDALRSRGFKVVKHDNS